MGCPVGLEQGGGAQRRSQSHSMALTSPRVPISRNVYQDKCCADALHRRIFYLAGCPSGTRTATTTTAACGRNREELLGPRSDFSKPCQGAAEKSANATRKALSARFRCGSQSIGMSTVGELSPAGCPVGLCPPIFSAKKACAGPLENCGFPGSAHAFLFSAFSLLQSALHLLQDLRDLCTGIAIPAQRTADAGIVFALTAHQHRHVGHRHVPRSVCLLYTSDAADD